MKPQYLVKFNNYYYHYEGKIEKVQYIQHTLNHRVFQSADFIHYLAETTVRSFITEIPKQTILNSEPNETTMDHI